MQACPIYQTTVESHTETYTAPYNDQEYKNYESHTCDIHWWKPVEAYIYLKV
ncbi:hypothetical protein [Thermodesulfobacterium commune]|uniref:hypothetical protein n=1 Tax=Thermodesulfobacterium commune TaxID=1741 RepID=UPI000AF9F0FF|nr:hypothetical protein [Thermodesulfobacterium commune]